MDEAIPIRLHCPECHRLHLDEGMWATKLHHTHACQYCGAVWRPAVVFTVGVQFLPGFQNIEADYWQVIDRQVDELPQAEASGTGLGSWPPIEQESGRFDYGGPAFPPAGSAREPKVGLILQEYDDSQLVEVMTDYFAGDFSFLDMHDSVMKGVWNQAPNSLSRRLQAVLFKDVNTMEALDAELRQVVEQFVDPQTDGEPMSAPTQGGDR